MRSAIARPSDRLVLIVLFASVFFVRCGLPLFSTPSDQDVLQPISFLSGAELIGFIAIAFVLNDLGADHVLRWWDFVMISIAAIGLIHPWHAISALILTGFGLLFFCRNNRALVSLAQLCIGLAWIDLWGKLLFSLIQPWLLPIETTLAYLPCPFLAHSRLSAMRFSVRTGMTWKYTRHARHFIIPS